LSISLVLLAGSPSKKPFAYFRTIIDSKYFLVYFAEFLAVYLAIPWWSTYSKGFSHSNLLSWSTVSLSSVSTWPRTYTSWTLLCPMRFTKDWWSRVFEKNIETAAVFSSSLIYVGHETTRLTPVGSLNKKHEIMRGKHV
jgi:hypothetical protein